MNSNVVLFQDKVKAKWLIAGQPDYVIGEDKQLYNIGIDKPKEVVNGGYVLRNRHYTFNELRPMLRHYLDDYKLPF